MHYGDESIVQKTIDWMISNYQNVYKFYHMYPDSYNMKNAIEKYIQSFRNLMDAIVFNGKGTKKHITKEQFLSIWKPDIPMIEKHKIKIINSIDYYSCEYLSKNFIDMDFIDEHITEEIQDKCIQYGKEFDFNIYYNHVKMTDEQIENYIDTEDYENFDSFWGNEKIKLEKLEDKLTPYLIKNIYLVERPDLTFKFFEKIMQKFSDDQETLDIIINTLCQYTFNDMEMKFKEDLFKSHNSAAKIQKFYMDILLNPHTVFGNRVFSKRFDYTF
jgi:hypothetical protein